MKFRRILVLCTGNICRSPMVEALLARELAADADRFDIASAGIGALVDHPADPHAVTLMARRQIDISGHRARQIGAAMALEYDLLLVMHGGQRRHVEERWPLLHGRVHELGRWGGFDIDDPYRQPLETFEACLTRIDQGVSEWLPILRR